MAKEANRKMKLLWSAYMYKPFGVLSIQCMWFSGLMTARALFTRLTSKVVWRQTGQTGTRSVRAASLRVAWLHLRSALG